MQVRFTIPNSVVEICAKEISPSLFQSSFMTHVLILFRCGKSWRLWRTARRWPRRRRAACVSREGWRRFPSRRHFPGEPSRRRRSSSCRERAWRQSSGRTPRTARYCVNDDGDAAFRVVLTLGRLVVVFHPFRGNAMFSNMKVVEICEIQLLNYTIEKSSERRLLVLLSGLE